MGGACAERRHDRRRRLRGRRPASLARRPRVHPRNQRHPRGAGGAAGDRARHLRRDRGLPGAARGDPSLDARPAATRMRSSEAQTASDIVAAAQLACLLEATAPKPGNVSPGHSFGDLAYEDLLASAAAIGGPLAGVGTRPLGTTIRLAIEATGRWTRSNTNLGMVLLLAPLARAAVLAGKGVGSLFLGERAQKKTPDPFSAFRDATGPG